MNSLFQNISTRDRAWDIARRSKDRRDRERDRLRTSSFRFVSNQGRYNVKSSQLTNDGYEMNSLRTDKNEEKAGHSRERETRSAGSKDSRKEQKGGPKLVCFFLLFMHLLVLFFVYIKNFIYNTRSFLQLVFQHLKVQRKIFVCITFLVILEETPVK